MYKNIKGGVLMTEITDDDINVGDIFQKNDEETFIKILESGTVETWQDTFKQLIPDIYEKCKTVPCFKCIMISESLEGNECMVIVIDITKIIRSYHKVNSETDFSVIFIEDLFLEIEDEIKSSDLYKNL
jgi:hypothetical protein